MEWTFDLSYSYYSLYKQSQLIFYYVKIIKSKPDTQTIQIYGKLGNVLHNFAEEYIKNKNIIPEFKFNEIWNKYHLTDNEIGLYNSKINKDKWLSYLLNIKEFIDTNLNYSNVETEKYLEYVGDEFEGLKIKGYLDVLVFTDDEIIIYDWKTNTSYNQETHRLQRKFYSWLCWKNYGIIPRCEWFYCKKKESHTDKFNDEDMREFTEELLNFKNEIKNKGDNINNYELGDYNNIFNNHLVKCEKINNLRNNKNIINIEIINNKLIISNLSDTMKKMLREKYKYFINGSQFSNLFKRGLWDGYKYFLKKDSENNILPIGFINSLKEFINDYNKYYNTNYKIIIDDKRNREVMSTKYNTKFKNSDKQLRDYQITSVREAINNKIGILYLGTSAGKTLIASEIIRQLNNRVLFVVNRIELVTQTHDVFKEELGVKIGSMNEGKLNIHNQITIASIQTLQAIMKRNDESSKELKKFLFNVNTVIYDEAQNLSDSSLYKVLLVNVINAEYIIGLTGSPFRNDNSTLEMNALVGFPIVSYSTEWLENNGYLCPTKTYFIKNHIDKSKSEKYSDKYSEGITHNVERNNKIVDVVNQFKGKKILILTKIIEHGVILQDLIKNSLLINSKTNIKIRKANMKKFRDDKDIVLIAGVKIAGAGLDIRDLDVVIIATAHKSGIDTVQTIGRLKRQYPGKKYGYLIDFLDDGDFYKTSMERVKILKEYGNNVEIIKTFIY